MGGGAWPFLVGGVICLVNSDNERDLNLLTSDYHVWFQSKVGGIGMILYDGCFSSFPWFQKTWYSFVTS